MSDYIKEYEFTKTPKKITYIDGEPLELSNSFQFYHNKNKFRKELNVLQYLFKDYTGKPLLATGIWDTYLKEENSENYLMVIFTTPEIIKNADEIISPCLKESFEKGSFIIKATSKSLLLLTRDMEGIKAGVEVLVELLKQTLEDYFKQKVFDDFIKMRPFELFY